MATSQKKWLRAISFIAIIGIGFAVKAEVNKTVEPKVTKKVAKAATVKKHKRFAAYTFYYNGPSYSVSDVTNESNWHMIQMVIPVRG